MTTFRSDLDHLHITLTYDGEGASIYRRGTGTGQREEERRKWRSIGRCNAISGSSSNSRSIGITSNNFSVGEDDKSIQRLVRFGGVNPINFIFFYSHTNRYLLCLVFRIRHVQPPMK